MNVKVMYNVEGECFNNPVEAEVYKKELIERFNGSIGVNDAIFEYGLEHTTIWEVRYDDGDLMNTLQILNGTLRQVIDYLKSSGNMLTFIGEFGRCGTICPLEIIELNKEGIDE